MSDMTVQRVAVRQLGPSAIEGLGSMIAAGNMDDDSLNRAPGQMAFLWVHQFLSYPKTPYIATGRYYFRGSRCEYLQRHPQSTLVLVPLGSTPSVIWVTPDKDGEPQLDAVQALYLDGKSGVVVKPGVWVRYAYPVGDFADFAYVSSRVDPEEDIERVNLEERFGRVLEWYFAAPDGEDVRLTPGGAVVGLPSRLPPGTVLGPGGRISRGGEKGEIE